MLELFVAKYLKLIFDLKKGEVLETEQEYEN